MADKSLATWVVCERAAARFSSMQLREARGQHADGHEEPVLGLTPPMTRIDDGEDRKTSDAEGITLCSRVHALTVSVWRVVPFPP